MRITRRKAFQLLGAGGIVGLSGIAGRAGATAVQEKPSAFPWKPRRLDPGLARPMAYQAYYEGSCCYGAFKAVVGQLADRYGSPYNSFPIEMMRYGEAGVAGFGTLCGTLNGSSAAFALMFEGTERDGLISELFNWYASSQLPVYAPESPKLAADIISTCAASLLCHVSATTWCQAAGKKPGGPERKERCARLTADVAGKAAQLLNEHLDGAKFVSMPPAAAGECLACHGKGKDAEISKGTMECAPCHGSKLLHQSILRKIMPIKKDIGLL